MKTIVVISKHICLITTVTKKMLILTETFLNNYFNKLGPVLVLSVNVVRDFYSVVYNKSTITVTFDVAGKPEDVVAFLDKLNEAVIKTEQGG